MNAIVFTERCALARLEGWATRQHPSRLAEVRRAPQDDGVLVVKPLNARQTGKSTTHLSSPFRKNIPVFFLSKSLS
jgi:hypothetical protein